MPKKSTNSKNHSDAVKRGGRKKNYSSSKSGKSNDSQRVRHSNRKPKIPERSAKNKFFAIFSDVLFYLFLVTAFSTVILTVLGKNEGLFIFGYRPLTVLTNSMYTTDGSHKDGFAAGDIIILKQIKGQDAKEGDIITYYTNPEKKEGLLTHRLVQTLDKFENDEKPYVVTKGDANTGNDIPIPITSIIGKKIYTIPKVGSFINFIKANMIASLIFVGVFVIIYMGLRKYLNMEEEKRLNPKRMKHR